MNFKSSNKYISSGIIATVGVLFFIMTCIFHWTGDGLGYSLIITAIDDNSNTLVSNLGDIFKSMYVHYFNWGGRVFCHYIVSIFCGLLSRPIFEICNIIVWLIFLKNLSIIARLKISNPVGILLLCVVPYLLLTEVPFDPPFLINYLWMGTFIILWLRTFTSAMLSGENMAWWIYPLIFIFSLLAGNSHEAFSAPIAGAVAIWIIMKRFRISAGQWVAAIGLALGTISVALAPGNFVRMEVLEHYDAPILENIKDFILQLLLAGGLLLCALVALIYQRKIHGNASFISLFFKASPILKILAISIPISLLIGIVMRLMHLDRILMPSEFAILILICRYWPYSYRRSTSILTMILIASFAATYGFQLKQNLINRQKWNMVDEKYAASTTGIVAIPDSLFFHFDGHNCYPPTMWSAVAQASDPDKPSLRVYPESLLKNGIIPDSTYSIRTGEQSWLLIKSPLRPAHFMIEKVLLPGIIDRPLPPREIVFDKADLCYIDTINGSEVMYYINFRPFIHSEIGIYE